MKNAAIVLVCAFAAAAGVLSISWGQVEGDFARLEIRAGGAVLAVLEKEDGVFPGGTELKEAFYVVPEDCISCQLCVSTCPVNAISVDECGKAVIDTELCINCGICAGVCPVNAIHPLNLEDCSLIGITPENDEIILQQGFEED